MCFCYIHTWKSKTVNKDRKHCAYKSYKELGKNNKEKRMGTTKHMMCVCMHICIKQSQWILLISQCVKNYNKWINKR